MILKNLLLKQFWIPQQLNYSNVFLQFFQQFTKINAIMFYAPVLFQTVGFGNFVALYSSVIVGTVNVLSTLVAIFLVDRKGHRCLLLEACIQMIVTEVHSSIYYSLFIFYSYKCIFLFI